MRKHLIFLWVAGLSFVVCPDTHAHIGDSIVPIFELSDADLDYIDIHDGSADEWEEIVGEPILTALDFVAWEDRASYDPSDLDYRIWMGWHDATDRIYIAMERVDDAYVGYAGGGDPNTAPWFAWSSDSGLQFLVDGDHSGGEVIYWGDDFPAAQRVYEDNKQGQYYMAAGEYLRDDNGVGVAQNGFRYREKWFRTPPFAEMGGGSFGENPTIAVTEFYVTPYDLLVWDDPDATEVSDLYPGKIIGFAMMMIDFDDSESTTYQSVHSFPSERWGVYTPADEFADGVLVNTLGQVPEDTALEAISWGRIKASFRE